MHPVLVHTYFMKKKKIHISTTFYVNTHQNQRNRYIYTLKETFWVTELSGFSCLDLRTFCAWWQTKIFKSVDTYQFVTAFGSCPDHNKLYMFTVMMVPIEKWTSTEFFNHIRIVINTTRNLAWWAGDIAFFLMMLCYISTRFFTYP